MQLWRSPLPPHIGKLSFQITLAWTENRERHAAEKDISRKQPICSPALENATKTRQGKYEGHSAILFKFYLSI